MLAMKPSVVRAAARGVHRRREDEAIDLSNAKTDYVKAIVRCAEDLGFAAELEAEKPAATQTGAAWTVELKLPSGQAAAFVRIEIK